MEKSHTKWKPSGPRPLKARFNSRYIKLAAIVCYAPTKDAEEADKDALSLRSGTGNNYECLLFKLEHYVVRGSSLDTDTKGTFWK